MIAAVIPAAGKSTRMGRPKLLVEFDGQTLVEHVVQQVRAGGVDRVVVVAPPLDSREGPQIAQAAQRAGAEVITPLARPGEMRSSVALAIEKLALDDQPAGILLCPADSPGLRSDVVARVVRAAANSPASIIIPCCGGRRGHPIVLPWSIAREVESLSDGMGVNALVARHAHEVLELELAAPEIALDLDTPEDLYRWREGKSGHITYKVMLFALAREFAGRSEIEIDLPAGACVGDLRAALRACLPRLDGLIRSAMVAVNEEYAADTQSLAAGARIALIPPVSGGAVQNPQFELPSVDARSRTRRPSPQ
jgi:molybdenum cofactor cytidylyltransferase